MEKFITSTKFILEYWEKGCGLEKDTRIGLIARLGPVIDHTQWQMGINGKIVQMAAKKSGCDPSSHNLIAKAPVNIFCVVILMLLAKQ